MPRTFFAFCPENDENVVFRIPIRAGVQDELENLFNDQEELFLRNRDEEILFDGDWKPDNNQLLVIRDSDLVKPFIDTTRIGPGSYYKIDVFKHEALDIKGIFSHSNVKKNRILLQKFTKVQILNKQNNISLVFSDGEFDRLSNPGFYLDSSLTAIIEGDEIKFVSFQNLRTILDIQDHYREATADEILKFSENTSLHFENVEAFNEAIDDRTRKLIHAIRKSKVLRDFDPITIHEKAKSIGLTGVVLRGNKLVIPEEKKEMKRILNFLEEGVYKGVFSEDVYETNSKRKIK